MPISLEFNEIYEPIFFTKARHLLIYGGRGRGGSFTCTQYFLHLVTQPQYFRGYIMREVLGDIRESLWLDIKDRIEEAELTELFQLDESKMTATFLPTGNTIVSKGFKKASKKQTAKLKSLAGATHVLVEEMEEISEADFKQLDDTLRTTKTEDIQLIGIFNPPPKGHWIWKKWFTLEPAHIENYFRAVPKPISSLLAIFSTYRDNIDNLNASFINNLNQYLKDDPEYYYQMVEGLISEGVRGRIFKNWKQAPCMPGIWPKFYGLDWGFSGDPLALVECENHNRSLWIEQKIYKHGLTNDDLHDELIRIGISKRAPIVADNAQPKDIEDMKRKGWNFIECKKESVKSSVKYLKQYEVHITQSSTDIWNEYENYAYALDQFKNPTEEPIDAFNHCFIGSTMIITSKGLKPIKEINEGEFVLTSKGFRRVIKRWDNGLNQVKKYLLQFDTFNISLCCTEDHLIKTTQGWIPIKNLNSTHQIYLSNILEVKHSGFIQAKNIFREGTSVFISWFGKQQIKERFQKAFMYIMRMKTHLIMSLQTLFLSNRINIYQITAKSDGLIIQNGLKSLMIKEENWQDDGIKQKRADNGILNTVKKQWPKENYRNINVNFAVRNIQQERLEEQNFVVKIVELKRVESESKKPQMVYDLMIDDYHEYFANGILVHNCIDAIRYALDRIRISKPRVI